jgi:hypothetical protein
MDDKTLLHSVGSNAKVIEVEFFCKTVIVTITSA